MGRTGVTLSCAKWCRKAVRPLKIKSPQSWKINWWESLYNKPTAGKGCNGTGSMRQHYRWQHVTGTVLDTALQRPVLYSGEGGEFIHAVVCIKMSPYVPHLLRFILLLVSSHNGSRMGLCGQKNAAKVMSLLRVGNKRHLGCIFSLLDHLLCKSPAAMSWEPCENIHRVRNGSLLPTAVWVSLAEDPLA